jgi:hypothetical protein
VACDTVPRFYGTREEAKNELKRRVGDIAAGRPESHRVDTVRFGHMSNLFVLDYEQSGKRSVGTLRATTRRNT